MLNVPWQSAPLPENESERLAELHNYQILDTEPELVFDRLARMAARHFKTPIALVSLVDQDRQWFKARHGVSVEGTERSIAFCAHAILQDEVLVVPNATTDPRFAGNPLVAGESAFRFYAGAPLTSKNGYKLGVLCVIDHVPRPDFSEEQKQELEELAAIVIDEMELRLSMRRARQDLDALKSTQKELEEARQKAERSTQEKSQFVATISHELRTPMNGILGMAYLLGDTPLDALQREYIDTINHSAKNLLLLINDVLDLSKIEAGELILDRKRFDIKNSFIQNVKLLKPLANKKSNMLLYTVESSVPDIIVGDPGHFAQIVTNLVGNAVKFTENGTVEALLRYDDVNNTIRCDIKDTGIGIPADKHEAIFEKFTQGDASITEKYGGTGLGLSITKQLVVMLGGTIGFDSTEKVGSHFWFTLPVTLPEEGVFPSPNKIAKETTADRVEAREAYVLVAEDHPINQLFLVALLKKFGFTKIDVAENGVEVMETIMRNTYGYKGRPYDAIFMDCMMPEQDGYETTRMIRDQEQQMGTGVRVPIIAMTANALAGDRETCFEAGMDEYLSKPLQPDKVKEIIAQWFVFPAEISAALPNAVPAEDAPLPVDLSRLQIVADTVEEQAVLLDFFFKLTKEIVSIMEDSRRGEEFTQWKNAAHKLKGAAGNMGMTALENICRESEKAANMTYSNRSALLRQLKDEVARVKAYIADVNPALLTSEIDLPNNPQQTP